MAGIMCSKQMLGCHWEQTAIAAPSALSIFCSDLPACITCALASLFWLSAVWFSRLVPAVTYKHVTCDHVTSVALIFVVKPWVAHLDAGRWQTMITAVMWFTVAQVSVKAVVQLLWSIPQQLNHWLVKKNLLMFLWQIIFAPEKMYMLKYFWTHFIYTLYTLSKRFLSTFYTLLKR